MSKWRVSFSFDKEYEADDEGDALMQADADFNLMSEARAELQEPEESDDAAQ
jgi:hypothetical protein